MAKILIIDDSTFEADHVKSILEAEGHDIFWAESGSRGMSMMTTHCPDLIILDLILPDISGINICRWIRQNRHMKYTPLVMLTSKGQVHERVEGLQEGATDYITKPFDDAELKARVASILREVALRDQLEKKNSEYEKLLKQLETISRTDPLTGLYNRRHFEDVLVSEYERHKRFNSPFSCMVLDVDFFKEANDRCGHGVGDIVLKRVAQLIQGEVRGVDTVARYGGDEFIVLLAQFPREMAEKVAARMILACNKYDFTSIDRECPRVTLSIGIASVPDPDLKMIDDIFKGADHALYKAKKSGRNCFKTATLKEIGDVIGG